MPEHSSRHCTFTACRLPLRLLIPVAAAAGVLLAALATMLVWATLELEGTDRDLAALLVGFTMLLVVLPALRAWASRTDVWFRYKLEDAVAEDARQILEAAERDATTAELLRAEAESVRTHLGVSLDGGRRRVRAELTALLNGFIGAITEPGWSAPPSPFGYSAARLVIAGICQVACEEGALRVPVGSASGRPRPEPR